MQVIAGLSFLMLVVSAWWVGLKLLAMARRTRLLPETSLGLMLISLMGLGYPLAVGAQSEAVLGLTLAKVLQSTSSALIDTGFLLLLVFNWIVFRAPKRWAKALCWLGGGALLAHWIAVTRVIGGLSSMEGAVEATTSWALVSLGVGALGAFWTAFEALRYRSMLERRLSMGLANVVVINRFLLWGTMGLATAAGALANLGFLLARIDVLSSPGAQLVTTLTGTAQAVLLLLTFSPPERYTRWLERSRETA